MTVKACSETSVELPISGIWDITVAVRDADGCLVDQSPVVTVTLPAGTTATPTVERLALGTYRATYEVGTAGRYVARAVAAGYGAVDFAAYVTATTAGTGMPTLANVLNYLGWATDNATGDAAQALATESAAQRGKCRVSAVYPDDLRGALYRRVARNLALKGIPLAVLRGNADGGDLVLPGNDPEVRRLEGPHRKLIVG